MGCDIFRILSSRVFSGPQKKYGHGKDVMRFLIESDEGKQNHFGSLWTPYVLSHRI